jgi:hypothetical protein
MVHTSPFRGKDKSPWVMQDSRSKCDSKRKKTGPDMIRACEGQCLRLELYNVCCFGAFGRVDNVELHLLAFGQRLKAAVLYVAEMNEHIAAFFTGNESKTFGIIEPLYGTCLHDELPPSGEIEATEKDKKNAAKPISLCGFPTRTSGTSKHYNTPSES